MCVHETSLEHCSSVTSARPSETCLASSYNSLSSSASEEQREKDKVRKELLKNQPERKSGSFGAPKQPAQAAVQATGTQLPVAGGKSMDGLTSSSAAAAAAMPTSAMVCENQELLKILRQT